MSETTITLSREQLEDLIRRVVREEVDRLGVSARSILDDPQHEGPDDPGQDDLLLRDALERRDKYRDVPEAVNSLGELRQEIARLEATDELPD